MAFQAPEEFQRFVKENLKLDPEAILALVVRAQQEHTASLDVLRDLAEEEKMLLEGIGAARAAVDAMEKTVEQVRRGKEFLRPAVDNGDTAFASLAEGGSETPAVVADDSADTIARLEEALTNRNQRVDTLEQKGREAHTAAEEQTGVISRKDEAIAGLEAEGGEKDTTIGRQAEDIERLKGELAEAKRAAPDEPEG